MEATTEPLGIAIKYAGREGYFLEMSDYSKAVQAVNHFEEMREFLHSVIEKAPPHGLRDYDGEWFAAVGKEARALLAKIKEG